MASPLSVPSKSAATTSSTPPPPPPPPPPSHHTPSLGLSPTADPTAFPPPSSDLPPILPLHHAAQINDLSFLSSLPLVAAPSDPSTSSSTSPVNERDAQGITALHWAAINGHVLFVKGLLERGADVDVRGGELDGTPLMWAARNGHLYIVHLLLKYSADPALTDSQSFNCLHLAVHSSSAFLLSYLLFTLQPLSVDTPDAEGHTSLAWACYQGDAISVELLLRAGADPRKKDNAGLTPLHWAVTKGNAACIKRLVEAGAELDARDGQGKTAREMAVELKSLSAYKRGLVDAGFDEHGRREDAPLSPARTRRAILVLPTLVMGLAFETLALLPWWSGVLLAAAEAFGMHHLVSKVLLNVKGPHQSDRITKSPYLCAIITASLWWCGYVWLSRFVGRIPGYALSNLLFGGFLALCAYTFYRSITLDPGHVPFAVNDVELKDSIEELVETGAFNGMNFCLTCMVRRPLRSKHSYATGRCVGRFDHYCPWVWNDVGVNNHRQFLVFLGSLIFGIMSFIRLSWGYFYHRAPSLPSSPSDSPTCPVLPEAFCVASQYDTFALAVTAWAALQLSWTVILFAVQCWQVARQMTTLEVSNVGRYGYMGGKPGVSGFAQQGAVDKWAASRAQASRHASNAADTAGDGDTPAADPLSLAHAPTRTSARPAGAFKFLLKLLGLDRFLSSSSSPTRALAHSSAEVGNPFDLGWRGNCVDFWTAGRELGVDYRSLWEVPEGGFGRVVRERKGREREAKGAHGRGRDGYERVRMDEV
ncbi:hypothetical protein JCM1840_002982 [Sporobolomyces johnsonii]